MAARLVAEDPTLWLSRSWTSRAPRSGESPDAYVFVERAAFEQAIAEGGFFEWAEFLGNLYGTPVADPPPGTDLLLEIDLQGAREVRRLRPEATLVLLCPPSAEIQEARLRARGDDEEHIARRIAEGVEEVRAGQALADAVVVNDELDRTVAEIASILEVRRRGGSPQPNAR